ncbi:hypothetical protein Glove_421g86 [Diversispora epigaea]|uniref:Uncharacterized protein n=1 Tax=Diversispora epigaea TaxID=1348612 RepID=A0A397GZA1_9GLOM|nr:hypothetical protein Glove_421g86 [Diversispora epigaea]
MGINDQKKEIETSKPTHLNARTKELEASNTKSNEQKKELEASNYNKLKN